MLLGTPSIDDDFVPLSEKSAFPNTFISKFPLPSYKNKKSSHTYILVCKYMHTYTHMYVDRRMHVHTYIHIYIHIVTAYISPLKTSTDLFPSLFSLLVPTILSYALHVVYPMCTSKTDRVPMHTPVPSHSWTNYTHSHVWHSFTHTQRAYEDLMKS